VSAQALEAFLARLYTDEELRREFLATPLAVARRAGLDAAQAAALAAVDRAGLELAAQSIARKRAQHEGTRPRRRWGWIRRAANLRWR
jgi:hypothetical protein